jgi:alpha-tubulin suppressor-like RCC1 family protein
VTIAAGGYHSLALKSDGSLTSWGWNEYGQGNPPKGNDFNAISAGWGNNYLALKSDGSIVGWGRNWDNQATPPDGNDFKAISAGRNHSLALKSDGSIICWGNNEIGQATPPYGNDFIAIDAGNGHSLALKSDGSIVGWGSNHYGQAKPPQGNDFIAISAGQSYSLALKSDGSIVGWGWNGYGQAAPPQGNDFVSIAAGGYHGLALKSDGSIIGWGSNIYRGAIPPDSDDFIAISAGVLASLALKSDGSIIEWGDIKTTPFTPLEGNNFVAISAGHQDGIALVNMKPVAIAGPNQITYAWLDGIADVNLDGSASYDDDNDHLDYYWSWTIDGNTYEANGVSPTIQLPVRVHEIELIVDDGWVLSEPDYCTITVIEPLRTKMWLWPATLNCHSGLNHVTTLMFLPEDIEPNDINDGPLTMYPFDIKSKYQRAYQIGRDRDARTAVIATFDKDKICDYFGTGLRNVEVAGRLHSGRYFYGANMLRIVRPYPHKWLFRRFYRRQ